MALSFSLASFLSRRQVHECSMQLRDEIGMRRLSLASTMLVLSLSLCTTCALQYLPDDPLSLRRNFTLYSVFVSCVSASGVMGAAKQNATLLSLFATHLLVDSTVCFAPRIVVLTLSLMLPALLCESAVLSTRNDEVYRVQQASRFARQFMASEYCQIGSWILECGLLFTALLLIGLQFWCGLKLRQYAHYLEEQDSLVSAEPERQLGYKEKLMYANGS